MTSNSCQILIKKTKPVDVYDIPESMAIIPNSKIPLRKIFKFKSVRMTKNDFLTLFYLKNKKEGTLLYCSIGEMITRLVAKTCGVKATNFQFVSIEELENGFCYAKMISSKKTVSIVFYDANIKNFVFYIPIRGNNYNYYLDTPVKFDENDMKWINEQFEGTGIVIKDPSEAQNYLFLSNEMIKDEIRHYATFADVKIDDLLRNKKSRDEIPFDYS